MSEANSTDVHVQNDDIHFVKKHIFLDLSVTGFILNVRTKRERFIREFGFAIFR